MEDEPVVKKIDSGFREHLKGAPTYDNIGYANKDVPVNKTQFSEVRARVTENLCAMNDTQFAAMMAHLANKGFPGMPVSYPNGSYRDPRTKLPF